MNDLLKRGFLLLLGGAVALLVAALLWVQSLPEETARALFSLQTVDRAATFEGDRPLTPEAQAERERLQAAIDCLPVELGIGGDLNSRGRLDRALGEMGNDQLERVFNLKTDPQLSEAEREFEACLRAKGVEPKAAARGT